MDLTGVALVTGSASGIGKATAAMFVAEGCRRIVLADVDFQGLEKTKSQLTADHAGAEVLLVKMDLRSEESVNSCIDQAIAKFGRLDYCCNIAGITLAGATTDFSTSSFDLLYEVNLRGVFFCERAQLRAFAKQEPLIPKHSKYTVRGVIVNVSSLAGLIAYPSLSAYAAFKHGVCGLTKSDAMEYGSKGVRINAVCPGAVSTNINQNLPSEVMTDWGDIGKLSAMGRVADAEELAQAVGWLCSGRASYVNGSVLSVNGGRVGGS